MMCLYLRANIVSILVLVDVSLEVPHYCCPNSSPDVSILVLVDVSLEARPILALFGCISSKMFRFPA